MDVVLIYIETMNNIVRSFSIYVADSKSPACSVQTQYLLHIATAAFSGCIVVDTPRYVVYS